MFIITITVNSTITPEQHESLFLDHARWFKYHFSTGSFVIVGPYVEQERAGVIIANITSRHDLTTILKQDPYYPDLATYDIREFIPKMITEKLHQQHKNITTVISAGELKSE